MSYFKTRINNLNLDLSHRCPLECPNCQRQTAFTNKGLIPYGRDLTLNEINMITDHFKSVGFCGQLSDPVHHPRFSEILEIFNKKNVGATIHNASTAKPISWFIKSFKAKPNARWVFACDGLPKDSHKYRKNQDGEKMFEIMKIAKQHLNTTPVWQFIIFNYNEDNIEEAKKMALENGLEFILVQSSRWRDDDGKPDPLRPKGSSGIKTLATKQTKKDKDGNYEWQKLN